MAGAIPGMTMGGAIPGMTTGYIIPTGWSMRGLFAWGMPPPPPPPPPTTPSTLPVHDIGGGQVKTYSRPVSLEECTELQRALTMEDFPESKLPVVDAYRPFPLLLLRFLM